MVNTRRALTCIITATVYFHTSNKTESVALGMHDPINDDGNYRYGVYFNKDDSRIIVPKRHWGMGYTLNFARIESSLLLIFILLVTFLLSK